MTNSNITRTDLSALKSRPIFPKQHPRPYWQRISVDALIAAWVVGMIGVPVLLWTVGDQALPWAITTNVILLAAGMTIFLVHSWGIGKAAQTVGIVLMLAWLVEYIGSSTGFPFGGYDYTGRFQPQIGHVPVVIPLAWLMMLPPAWAVGQLLAPGHRVLHWFVSALAFTAWDLFLDPQMVAWGVWQWHHPHGYFGIPWQNFLGWILGAFVLSAAVRPRPLAVLRPLVVYGITLFLQTVGLALFWNMPGPALVGAGVMGAFFFTALWKYNIAARRA